MPGKPGKPSKADRIKDATRRQEKQAAQDICKDDIRQYTIIFERVRADQAAELAVLEATVADMQQRLPPAEGQRQPTEFDGATDTKASEYLINLEMAFEDHDDTIFDGAKAVAVELGHSFHPGPAKKSDRQEEKASNAYNGDYSLLKVNIDWPHVSVVQHVWRTPMSPPQLPSTVSFTRGPPHLRPVPPHCAAGLTPREHCVREHRRD